MHLLTQTESQSPTATSVAYTKLWLSMNDLENDMIKEDIVLKVRYDMESEKFLVRDANTNSLYGFGTNLLEALKRAQIQITDDRIWKKEDSHTDDGEDIIEYF